MDLTKLRICRCGVRIAPSGSHWIDGEHYDFCQDTGDSHEPADITSPWVSLGERLLVHEGDRVLDGGQVETVTEIHWRPDRDRLYVRVGYASGGALRMKEPHSLVAVHHREAAL